MRRVVALRSVAVAAVVDVAHEWRHLLHVVDNEKRHKVRIGQSLLDSLPVVVVVAVVRVCLVRCVQEARRACRFLDGRLRRGEGGL